MVVDCTGGGKALHDNDDERTALNIIKTRVHTEVIRKESTSILSGKNKELEMK